MKVIEFKKKGVLWWLANFGADRDASYIYGFCPILRAIARGFLLLLVAVLVAVTALSLLAYPFTALFGAEVEPGLAVLGVFLWLVVLCGVCFCLNEKYDWTGKWKASLPRREPSEVSKLISGAKSRLHDKMCPAAKFVD